MHRKEYQTSKTNLIIEGRSKMTKEVIWVALVMIATAVVIAVIAVLPIILIIWAIGRFIV